MKILIVDDNAEMRRMTRFFLPGAFDFDECADALECCEKTGPDWVLMNWEMKRMNGIEATRRIIAKHPQAKIVIVTQYDDPELKSARLNRTLNARTICAARLPQCEIKIRRPTAAGTLILLSPML